MIIKPIVLSFLDDILSIIFERIYSLLEYNIKIIKNNIQLFTKLEVLLVLWVLHKECEGGNIRDAAIVIIYLSSGQAAQI